MSAPALAGRPSLRIGGTHYPVLLPTLRDPRLHLAGVIVSLQVLGQVAFDFQLSIAQILVSLAVAGVLEVAIAFRSQHVLMWPASALLTGNGVAFVLRVPGTEHGDWWSMNGWWIFAGTSAVALLSKYLVRVRRNHVFNPSNFGLVLCFLLLGAERADPLALWWGPLSPALVLALVLIVAGGFLILRRLHLVGVAVGFWLAFAAGIGVLAASGHTMTAAWHVGPIEGAEFWWLLVSSPEILVFLFFMITDPKTIPASPGGRRAYAVAVGLLATLLIAPQTTEFATKVAILAALFVVCAARGVIELVGSERLAAVVGRRPRRRMVGAVAFVSAAAYAGLVVAAGIPARPDADLPRAQGAPLALPEVTVVDSQGVAAIDDATAQRIARDVMTDLRFEAEALERRDRARAADAAAGEWLAVLWRQIDSAATTAPTSEVERIELRLLAGDDQGPPTVVARLERTDAAPRTVELALADGRYRIVRSQGGTPARSRGGVRDQRHARRHLAHECRAGGRPELPARGVPVRDVERHVGDDGRRSLLDRLRLGRLARPVRRQLVRAERHARVGGTRGAASERPVPECRGQVRRRECAHGCRSAAPRERLRCRRPRPRRPHRPVRDERGLQRRRPTDTTRCSGTTATGRSPRVRATQGSTEAAGTRAPR